VQFIYPDVTVQGPAPARAAPPQAARSPINSNYTMQAKPATAEIVPDAAYDDGRLTFLHFAEQAELPAVFSVADDRSEELVNLHMDSDWMVLHGVYRRLVLRLGPQVVGLWNDGWSLASDDAKPPVAPLVKEFPRELGSP
jgi:type IV secretion system protein VirB9